MRSNLQPSPTAQGQALVEVASDLDQLLKEKLHELSPAKRRLLELFLTGDDLDFALLETEEEHVAPRTTTEMELCGIWQEVLGLDAVGVQDNFFDLGGDSILSIRIVAKANRLGMPLNSRQLFENPTIEALAALVDSQPRRSVEEGMEFPNPFGRLSSGLSGELSRPQIPHAEGTGAWTPEDFPEAELSSDDLQRILHQTSEQLRSVETALAGGAPFAAAEAAALRVTAEMPRPLVLRAARF